MTTRWYAVALLLTALLTACGGASSHPAPTPQSTPPTAAATSPPAAPTIPLTADAFLGMRYLRPARWSAQKTKSSAQAGNVTYTAPARRGTLYIERNDCAACVDQGLVKHGHRNGVPDPANALTSYFPTSQHALGSYDVSFTTAATKPYVATGKLTVTRAHGELTGYVVMISTLPARDAATTNAILSSLRIS